MKKTKSMERPEITLFTDYRVFLKSVFEWKKNKKKEFSYEYCARKINVSKSYLKQVFDKKIHVDLNRVPQLAKLFNSTDFEYQYLVVMLLENQVKVPALKIHFKKILDRLKFNSKIPDFKKYLNNIRSEGDQLPDWLALTIGSLTEFPDFSENPNWIQKKISGSLPIEEISKKWDSMIDNKMILKKGNKYVESSSHSSPDPFETEWHKRYLHGAVKAVDVLSSDLKGYDPAFFFNGAIAISSEDFTKVSDCFCRLTNEIIEIGKKVKIKIL